MISTLHEIRKREVKVIAYFLKCGFHNYLSEFAPAHEHSVTHTEIDAAIFTTGLCRFCATC